MNIRRSQRDSDPPPSAPRSLRSVLLAVQEEVKGVTAPPPPDASRLVEYEQQLRAVRDAFARNTPANDIPTVRPPHPLSEADIMALDPDFCVAV